MWSNAGAYTVTKELSSTIRVVPCPFSCIYRLTNFQGPMLAASIICSIYKLRLFCGCYDFLRRFSGMDIDTNSIDISRGASWSESFSTGAHENNYRYGSLHQFPLIDDQPLHIAFYDKCTEVDATTFVDGPLVKEFFEFRLVWIRVSKANGIVDDGSDNLSRNASEECIRFLLSF
ncbi:hypothetical protein DSL72_002620 [Monilinia vaccinii-corymbosi]|uniref:Uncharacterized protein n=1 Tax=Monilinia vaccinii-corymbosi TaxID=61207 RepID=A0A8A3PD67_9HELO|nr:hypothetical protein DSL72_002620 [Monilinia vaccinii-corymbosi]